MVPTIFKWMKTDDEEDDDKEKIKKKQKLSMGARMSHFYTQK